MLCQKMTTCSIMTAWMASAGLTLPSVVSAQESTDGTSQSGERVHPIEYGGAVGEDATEDSSEQDDGFAELKSCQILYISNSERGRLKDIFAALEGQPVLLVADVSGFAIDGGMIGFVLEQQRIIFEINREALEQANLKASAKLLKLARIVKPKDWSPQGSRTAKGKP